MTILKIKKRTLVITHDLLMSVLAWLFPWFARFNFSFPFDNWEKSFLIIPIIILLQLFIFQRFRLYRGLWRFASIPDLLSIVRASITSAICMRSVCIFCNKVPKTIDGGAYIKGLRAAFKLKSLAEPKPWLKAKSLR